MNERVQGCGGRLSITPLAGHGTQVEAIFPLAQIDEMALGVAE
jgi:signal transduction histidine kinase